MRAARFLCLLGLLLLAPAATAATAGPAATAGAPSAATTATAADSTSDADTLFVIYPEKGPWVYARRVEPWSFKSIRYRTPEGKIGYLDYSKVVSIKDASGEERSDEVLYERRPIGRAVGTEDQSFGSWLLSPIRKTPDRDRRSYFLAEVGYAGRLGGEPARGAADGVLQTGLGWMKNVSRDWALGGLLQFQGDLDQYHSFAAGVRARRYLGDYWSLEASAGAFAADYRGGGSSRGLPLFAELGASVVGSVGFFTRFEHHEFRYDDWAGGVLLGDVDSSDDIVTAGIRLGPRPRVLAIPAAILGTLAAMSGSSESNP